MVAECLGHAEETGCFPAEADEGFPNAEGADLFGQARVVRFELAGGHGGDGGVGESETDLGLGVGGDDVGQVERLLCGEQDRRGPWTGLPGSWS